ncbi:MAG: hypothetical protein R3B91_01875 [Planctomycetaceae bacterium]
MRNRPELMTPDRLDQGYIIVLPGIEGESVLNRNIVRGLLRANVPYGIEIYDWTYGLKGYLLNLRYRRRHREQAEIICDKLANYRCRHPHQPVYLIGHSGGGSDDGLYAGTLAGGRSCDRRAVTRACLVRRI